MTAAACCTPEALPPETHRKHQTAPRYQGKLQATKHVASAALSRRLMLLNGPLLSRLVVIQLPTSCWLSAAVATVAGDQHTQPSWGNTKHDMVVRLTHLLLGSCPDMSCTRVMKLSIMSCSFSSLRRVSAISSRKALRFLALSRISDRLSYPSARQSHTHAAVPSVSMLLAGACQWTLHTLV